MEQPLVATDEIFLQQYGRFKIVLLMPDGQIIKHYGRETSVTMQDMLSGKITTIDMNAQKAYLDCTRYEEAMHNRYTTAVIYQRTKEGWSPVSIYVKGLLTQSTYLHFKDPVTRFKVHVTNNILYIERIGLTSSLKEDETAKKSFSA